LHEASDRKGEADVLSRFGYTYFCLGEMKKAIDYYDQAATTYREIHSRYLEGTMLANLGDAYAFNGDNQVALDKYSEALSRIRAVGDKQWESLTLNSI